MIVWKQLKSEIWMTMKMNSLVVKKCNVKFYTMFRILNKSFCSAFDNRNNTNVSWLANFSNFFQKFKLKKIFVVGLLVIWKHLKIEIWLTMKMDSVVKQWNVKFYKMFRIANKVFCSVFDDRNKTSVSELANISNSFQKTNSKNPRFGLTGCMKTA